MADPDQSEEAIRRQVREDLTLDERMKEMRPEDVARLMQPPAAPPAERESTPGERFVDRALDAVLGPKPAPVCLPEFPASPPEREDRNAKPPPSYPANEEPGLCGLLRKLSETSHHWIPAECEQEAHPPHANPEVEFEAPKLLPPLPMNQMILR